MSLGFKKTYSTYRCLRKKGRSYGMGYVILQNCTNRASIELTVNLFLFFSSEIYHLPSLRGIWLGDERYDDPLASFECLECLAGQKSISSKAQLWKKLFNLETLPLSSSTFNWLLILAEINFLLRNAKKG